MAGRVVPRAPHGAQRHPVGAGERNPP
ncbi:hypothetical protein STRIP9103_06503, partial [Streptomyces ipomoeae 91-03]